MSRIEELIREKCPDGVLYKSIESLVSYKRGKGLSKDDKGTGDNPILLYGELYTTYGDYIDRIVSFASDEVILSSVKICKGDVVLPISSTTKEAQIGKASVLRCNIACLGGDAVAFTPKSEIMSEFLMYVINSGFFEMDKMKCVKGVTIRHLDTSKMMLIEIPVPPIEVQQEIVRILDKFTELEAELQAELDARKKQYEYYHDELLKFDESVVYESLESLCDIVDYRGKTPKKVDSGVFLVTAKNIRKGYIDYEASQEFIAEEDYLEVMRRGLPQIGDVLFTTEAPCGNVAQIDREDIALAQRVIKYRPKGKKLNSTFLKYVLLGSEFQNKLLAKSTGGTVKGIKGSVLHTLTVPVPSIEEQLRIVEILDKFNEMCNNCTVGLPAEVAIRKKQYEYYRDSLLSFKWLGE